MDDEQKQKAVEAVHEYLLGRLGEARLLAAGNWGFAELLVDLVLAALDTEEEA